MHILRFQRAVFMTKLEFNVRSFFHCSCSINLEINYGWWWGKAFILKKEVENSDDAFNQQAKKAKQAEIERKRAEVRKRMEEASKAKKAKKGFMTPERKKKLRVSYR